jgi:hypothetical protein
MEALVNLLPTSWRPRAKAIVGALGISLTVASTTIPHASLWITVPLAILSALTIYQVPAPGYVAPSDAALVE